jgi:DNA helicase-2/ATP-dependent DNA helicase PcrA
VGEVLKALERLERHRFCAVVTYTNAATSELRRRISEAVPVPSNLFIGTIHSFLGRFILQPFGHLCRFRLQPSGRLVGLPPEMHYIEGISDPPTARDSPAERKAKQKRARDLALQHGLIAYDVVLQLSKEVLENEGGPLRLVAERLQFLFVDEYQDATPLTHKILQKFWSFGRTEVTLIGDPLQSIFRFACGSSLAMGESAPRAFKHIPILKAVRESLGRQVKVRNENYRSRKCIVDLINNYLATLNEQEYLKSYEVRQKPMNQSSEIPVYFIDKYSPADILRVYEKIKEEIKDRINGRDAGGHTSHESSSSSGRSTLRELILTHDWIDRPGNKVCRELYEALKQKGVSKLKKGRGKAVGFLEEVSARILVIVGLKRKDFLSTREDELRFRKFCLKIIRSRPKPEPDAEAEIGRIREEFKNEFKIEPKPENRDVQIGLPWDDFVSQPAPQSGRVPAGSPESCYSTIHSAKGMEASYVLAIAQSEQELERWLNFQRASEDMNDDYRLGYVAFSRARDLLCIACLKQVSEGLKGRMDDLGIKVTTGDSQELFR